MNACLAAMLAALLLMSAAPCRAEGDAYLLLDGGIGYFAPPEVSYAYSTAEPYDITTAADITWGLGFRAGHTLHVPGWSEDSLFGAAPTLELAYRYDAYDERTKDITRPNAAAPAAGYGVTDPWSGGIWDYDQEITGNDVRLGLWGSAAEDGAFVPYVGVGYRHYRQDWKLNTFILGTYNPVFDSELHADSYGVCLGGKWETPGRGRWRVAATPMVHLDYTRASLDFHQHAGFAMLSGADDSMDTAFGSWGASLDVSAARVFANGFSLEWIVGAVYQDRTPYARPPVTDQGRAQIATDGSHALRCAVNLGLEF